MLVVQRRAGAKGFGLFAAQDLVAGQFIIEYVGEVIVDALAVVLGQITEITSVWSSAMQMLCP